MKSPQKNDRYSPILSALSGILGEEIPTNLAEYFSTELENLKRKHMLESIRLHGTPQYFLDTERLRERAQFFIRTMETYIKNCKFFYAFKCNDLPWLVNVLLEEGYNADVAGLFELELALKCGFDTIIFSSPGKSVDELKLALAHSDKVTVIIDNFNELDRLEALCQKIHPNGPVSVGLRLTPDKTINLKWQKFGFFPDQLPSVIQRIGQSPHMEWRGLHFHCSWNKTPSQYCRIIESLGTFVKEHVCSSLLHTWKFLDIGGGYYPEDQALLHHGEEKGILAEMISQRTGTHDEINELLQFDPYAFHITAVDPLDIFAKDISAAVEEHILPLNREITLYFEPGRFIATHSTSILLSVLAVKQNCAIVDGGINMLGDYKFSEYSFAPVVNLTRPSQRLNRCTIYGPLCDPSDLWGYSYFGDDLQVGDRLAVLHQGAYTFSTAWRFIKPGPPYIATSGSEFIVARSAEKFTDRYAGCRFR